jgi:hypothetical protein
MPKISEFFGIIIAMFYNDHYPPHFHARYSGYKATFSIEDLRILEGELPKRVISLILEWAFLHREELKREWELAKEHKPLFWIKPLE